MTSESCMGRGTAHKLSARKFAITLLAGAMLFAPLHGALADADDRTPFNRGDDALPAYQTYPTFEVAQSPSKSLDGTIAPEYRLSTQLAQSAEDVNDPLEGFNRAMFSFNEGFYDIVMTPLANLYNVLPGNLRMMIGSVLNNLGEPVVLINDLLQGEWERAFTTARRFTLNSTIGLGGIADVASSFGMEAHEEDFGQTLAVWGMDEGFYLVLPILGPGNPRDSIGRFLVDPMVDPVNGYFDNHGHDDLIWARVGASSVVEFSEIKDELEQVKKTSVDYYAAVRSLYRQRRAAEISNGEDMDLPAIPDFEFSDFPEFDDPEPALGSAGDAVQDDQASIIQTYTGSDVATADPFETRFNPAQTLRDAIDSHDEMAAAPRKPSQPQQTSEVAALGSDDMIMGDTLLATRQSTGWDALAQPFGVK